MKTHFQTGVTLSLKNLKGTVTDVSKRIIHRIGVPVKKQEEYGLDQGIVDLNTVISADLAVIDARSPWKVLSRVPGWWETRSGWIPLSPALIP